MRLKYSNFIVFLLVSLGTFTTAFYQYSGPKKVEMRMQMRTAVKGVTTTMNATLYYSSDGKMVTLMDEPYKVLTINTAKGELAIYNFAENSVLQDVNSAYSTESNNLIFFLQNRKADMGLAASGFSLKATKFEDGLKITTWLPPMQLSGQLSEVELVFKKANPIFMEYRDKRGSKLKTIFFYQFADLYGVDFPTAITEITYNGQKDSIITKTSYSNFIFNEAVNTEYLNFEIPTNAKVIVTK